MKPAIMDLFSSLSGFFVGQRRQLVQYLPSFFVFVLISTSSRLAFIPPSFAKRTCFAPYFFHDLAPSTVIRVGDSRKKRGIINRAMSMLKLSINPR